MVSASPLTRSSHHAGEDFARLRAARDVPALRPMPQFTTKRRVRHSAADMFDLVADVESYPEFVPLCRELKVRQRTPEAEGVEIAICRDMTVAYKLVRETFTTRVTLDRPKLQILVEYLQGPFSHLENRWTFRADSARTPARSSSSSPTSSRAAPWRC